MCNVRPKDRISAEEHITRLNWIAWGDFFRIFTEIEDYHDLVIQEEWKGVHGPVDEEPSRVVVVSLKYDLGKYEMR